TFDLNETMIYGSSRMGLRDRDATVAVMNFNAGAFATGNPLFNITADSEVLTLLSKSTERFSRTMGKTRYELTNYLGNVNAVVSDRKIAIEEAGSTGVIDFYEADVYSASDYFPFGMEMTGRNFVGASGYRFGFNGMEGDGEWSGSGNHYTTMFRQYDPRLGKWLTRDPVNYPWQSTYAAFNNNPIVFNDPLGLEGGKNKTPKAGKKNPKYAKWKKRKTGGGNGGGTGSTKESPEPARPQPQDGWDTETIIDYYSTLFDYYKNQIYVWAEEHTTSGDKENLNIGDRGGDMIVGDKGQVNPEDAFKGSPTGQTSDKLPGVTTQKMSWRPVRGIDDKDDWFDKDGAYGEVLQMAMEAADDFLDAIGVYDPKLDNGDEKDIKQQVEQNAHNNSSFEEVVVPDQEGDSATYYFYDKKHDMLDSLRIGGSGKRKYFNDYKIPKSNKRPN
ncbi:hypothetical protein JYU20_01025, partial [Bacteroidales bacterium AH-315-I05]|nr:hypothetical protein [Bacteroidales bacterium AH-315-I05]